MKFFFLALFTSLILFSSGCSWNPGDASGNPYYYPRAGSKIVLNQRLSIRPDTASVSFQYGKITTSYSRFDPYCKIRVRDVRPVTQTIMPDTFTVTSSGYHTEFIAGLSGLSIPLSSPLHSRWRVTVSGDGPSDITETVQMTLSSPQQPQVLSLICGGAENHPAEAEPPTMAEMKQAVGSIMSFSPR